MKKSNGKTMFFCFFPSEDKVCRLKLNNTSADGSFTDILSGNVIEVKDGVMEFKSQCRNLAVLVENK